MRSVESPQSSRSRGIPWLPLILFLASLYVFWVLPYQLGDRPVKVEFETAGAGK